MDGSGGLDLSGSQDNEDADNVLSMLESCIDWELDSEFVLDPLDNDNGEGNQDAILLEDPASTPAARFAVERLTKVVMKGKTDEVCVICCEEVKKEEKVYKLPCSHCYHGNCKPWLRMHNTCPICRFELPSENDQNTCL